MKFFILWAIGAFIVLNAYGSPFQRETANSMGELHERSDSGR